MAPSKLVQIFDRPEVSLDLPALSILRSGRPSPRPRACREAVAPRLPPFASVAGSFDGARRSSNDNCSLLIQPTRFVRDGIPLCRAVRDTRAWSVLVQVIVSMMISSALPGGGASPVASTISTSSDRPRSGTARPRPSPNRSEAAGEAPKANTERSANEAIAAQLDGNTKELARLKVEAGKRCGVPAAQRRLRKSRNGFCRGSCPSTTPDAFAGVLWSSVSCRCQRCLSPIRMPRPRTTAACTDLPPLGEGTRSATV